MTTRPDHSAASIRHAAGTEEQSEPWCSGESEAWHTSEVEECSERAAALGEELEADADRGFAPVPPWRPARMLVLLTLGGVLAGLGVIAALALMGGHPRGSSPERGGALIGPAGAGRGVVIDAAARAGSAS